MNLLEIDRLTIAYGMSRVVRGASFSVAEGEAYAILGANGAGKTSILRAISGLVRVVDGDIRYDGRSILNVPAHAVASLGIAHVPEGRKIFAEMTVLENLLVGATVHIRNRKRTARMIERNFDLFPVLSEKSDHPGGSLSGGQQQQLTIARGLMSDPRLLIVDEPTLGLAPAVIQMMGESFRRLLGLGLTIVIAEQNADFALSLANRGVVLSGGEVSFEGGVDALRNRDVIHKAYLGA